MVLRPDGERDFIYREPLEGWVAWAKGFDGIIIEYPFGAVIHAPPPKKKAAPK
jgi:hypothetical protein